MRDQSAPAARIAAIAARQYGVIAHRQLLETGLSAAAIARWADAGHLHRIRRGVYAVGHADISRGGLYLAAVLAGGPGAALSHTAGARHLGLDRTRTTGTIHLSVPRSNRRRPPGVLVHRPRSLPARDVIVYERIRTTTATRTLFDLAGRLSPAQLSSRFDRAIYLEALDRRRLNELVATGSGHPGVGILRALLAATPIPLERIRSELEGIALKICRTHSLPVPGVNVPLLDFEVDLLWPDARFVVEADGGHHVGERRDADNERDLVLQRAGYLVRRYGEGPLANPDAVAAEILTILRERLPSATTSARSSA